MKVLLEKLAYLSRCFGIDTHVKGGGGNSSAKDDKTVWVKPSGCTMSSMEANKFVALDREKLLRLDSISINDEVGRREERAKDLVADAVEHGSTGRPSVEAPLHNLFSATYVIHTHPPLVNGMTCAVDGANVCKKLFPEALWMDYIDPGITLYHEVSDKFAQYKAKYGKEPQIIFLKNHGVFVAADTPGEMDEFYETMMNVLSEEYKEAGVSLILSEVQSSPLPEDIKAINASLSAEETHTMIATSAFDVASGPLTPDHVVYMKAFAHTGDISEGSIAAFQEEKGYTPKVFAANNAVYAAGTSLQNASLVLELARDGAWVKQLTKAFGGPEYMTDRASDFIENWEVESYRRKQI
jgi:rhamnose utilization protein RhaD (predicted bifunctional aldolase and dehydrogenase)